MYFLNMGVKGLNGPKHKSCSLMFRASFPQIQGAIMVASLFQILIGFSGLVGVLLRFIGPLTIAPTITLVGISLFTAAASFSGWFSFIYQ